MHPNTLHHHVICRFLHWRKWLSRRSYLLQYYSSVIEQSIVTVKSPVVELDNGGRQAKEEDEKEVKA